MSGLRESKKRQTRGAILDAAVRLFGRRGFEATSMEELAREAGVGKGTIYGYFHCKDEILLAYAEEEVDYAFAALAEKGDPEGPLVDQLLTLFLSQFDFVTRNREFGRCFMRELVFPADTTRARSRDLDVRYLRGIGAILERARHAGQLDPEADLLLSAGHFYSLYLVVLSTWYSGYFDRREDVVATLRALLVQALDGLGAVVQGEPAPPETLRRLKSALVDLEAELEPAADPLPGSAAASFPEQGGDRPSGKASS